MTVHSLSTILQARNPELLVAWDADNRYTQTDFLYAVNTLRNTLTTRSEMRWMLVHENTYRFAVGLFALLAAGKAVLLPPNAQPGTLSDLMQQADAFLNEEMFSCCEKKSQKQTNDVLPLLDFDTLDLDALSITLLTSGSTGEPKAVRKTLRCLDAEIHALESLFGSALGNAAILATVSHQRIYGLLFRLLWPLCAGRAFAAHTHQYPEQLIAEVLKPVALISSPSQLKRFPPTIDLATTQPHLAAVFSSGGLLPLEAAQDWQTRAGQTPIEVLGSTETGGVAWRCQITAHTPWQPLPSVQVTTDDEQNLFVQSPFTGTAHPLSMGDRATLQTDGHFQLLGRADRVVKIEEKRLSLTSMEQHLLTSPLVEAAHILLLPTNGGRLGAVVLLTAQGKHLLQAQGKHALNQHLREHLLAHFERILLPRKWRFPEQFPSDAQGKISLAALTAVFADPDVADPIFNRPAGYRVQVLEHTADGKRLQISLPPDSPLFDGHFPGLPILPGVVQFDIAVRQCADWYPLADFRCIEKLKFQEPVVPGDCITLTLQLTGKGQVTFRYSLDDKPLSSGKVVFAGHT